MPADLEGTNESQTPSDAVQLATYLATHDIRCPVCKYDLRLIESDRCPECGASLQLRVGSSDLRLKYWITVLLAFTIPLGFFGVVSIMAASYWLSDDFNSDEDRYVFVISAVFTATVSSIVLLLIRVRRWFWRLSPIRQRMLGLISLMLGGAAIGAFFWFTGI